MDTLQNLRSEMVKELIDMGIAVEAHHHEVATGGQCEIDMRYQDLVTMADNVMMYKYVAKNVAARHGKVVTFMPKPLFQDNGSGMHIHFSALESRKDAVVCGQSNTLASVEMGLWAIGGILKHAGAHCVLCVTRRLTATNGWCRVTKRRSTSSTAAATARPRCVSRCTVNGLKPSGSNFARPTAVCNPYLAFSAMTMAAIDGIKNRIDPGEPVDRNLYELDDETLAKIGSAPGSLEDALDALESDHEFLLEGNVFTADVIHYWIKYKRENEVDAIRLRPHPYEFCMYFDI